MASNVLFQYATKLVCGNSNGKILAPGVYFTAVNVHNPTYTTVDFRVKVAVALPGLQPGPVSEFRHAKLGPDEALEIDCPDIFNREIFKFPEPVSRRFIKGFVVIESKVELDVVAVYTAAGREKFVETLHTERVPARQLRAGAEEVCVDFELPLTLGTQYGEPAGHHPGDIIFTSNGIPVSVHEFEFIRGDRFFNVATIALVPYPYGAGQSISPNNINLEFDFSGLGFTPTKVSFEFQNHGGHQNLSINGSEVFKGDLSSAPSPMGGVDVSVSPTPAEPGTTGTMTLTGPVEKLRVGGQQFYIDNVCARE